MRLVARCLVLTLACCQHGASAPPPTASTTPIAPIAPVTTPLNARVRPAYDTSCNHDWECTPAPACCVSPCTGNVINARELERARADLQCDPSVLCPSAGGCITFSYLCVEHVCKIAFQGEPGYRQRQPEP